MDESIHIDLSNNVSDLVYNSIATVIRPSNEQLPPLGSGTAENKIIEWRLSHPSGTKKQRKDDTGLSYPTIRKCLSIVK